MQKLIKMQKDEISMTTLEIAEQTGKRHKNVMRDVRKMFKSLGKEDALPIFEQRYKAADNNIYTCYKLPKDEILCLVSGYSVKLRMAIIKRLNELENNTQTIELPGTYLEALETLVVVIKEKNVITEERDVAIEKTKILKKKGRKLVRKIKKDKPKVQYYNKVLDSKSCFTITQIAKQAEMTATHLNTVLEQENIQFKQSGQWLLKKEYQDKGLVSTRTHTIGRQIEKRTSHSTVWTEKGRLFILELLEDI